MLLVCTEVEECFQSLNGSETFVVELLVQKTRLVKIVPLGKNQTEAFYYIDNI